jgi:hypothetical protein
MTSVPEEYGYPFKTSIIDGELYTIVTSKAAKGRKGAIVAIVAETKADDVIGVLERILEELLRCVKLSADAFPY